MALSKKAQKIEKAYKELQYLSQDKVARAEYDEYVEAKIDEQMKIHYATEKGKKEKSIEIAKEMLKSKVPKEEIAKYIKLSLEEINKIENEIKDLL